MLLAPSAGFAWHITKNYYTTFKIPPIYKKGIALPHHVESNCLDILKHLFL
jgi:hypothetical protein